MARGHAAQCSDACAQELLPAAHGMFRLVVAITSGCSQGPCIDRAMELTAKTSPLLCGWVQAVPQDLAAARAAVAAKDLAGWAA